MALKFEIPLLTNLAVCVYIVFSNKTRRVKVKFGILSCEIYSL